MKWHSYTLVITFLILNQLVAYSQAANVVNNLESSLKKRENSISKIDQKNIAFFKSNILYFSKSKQYDSLKHYIGLYDKFLESRQKEITSNEIAKWRAKYQTEKKVQELNRLNGEAEVQTLKSQQKNIFIIITIVGIGIAIVFTILYSRQIKIKVLNKEAKIEQKMLLTQMNPHFISNALVSIEKFIYTSSIDEAGKYLTRFSKLMRRTLENSRMTTISLHDEVETLQHYLELQKLRYENKFDYAIEIDEKLDLEEVHIPPMFGQPIIENAIEHGLANKEEKGFIKVAFMLDGSLLILKVEDNGVGINESMKLNKHEHHSVSTTIANERILLMNMINQKKATFEHHDVVDKTQNVVGTKAIFTFPIVRR